MAEREKSPSSTARMPGSICRRYAAATKFPMRCSRAVFGMHGSKFFVVRWKSMGSRLRKAMGCRQ
jgi:hypothetical protein